MKKFNGSKAGGTGPAAKKKKFNDASDDEDMPMADFDDELAEMDLENVDNEVRKFRKAVKSVEK